MALRYLNEQGQVVTKARESNEAGTCDDDSEWLTPLGMKAVHIRVKVDTPERRLRARLGVACGKEASAWELLVGRHSIEYGEKRPSACHLQRDRAMFGHRHGLEALQKLF